MAKYFRILFAFFFICLASACSENLPRDAITVTSLPPIDNTNVPQYATKEEQISALQETIKRTETKPKLGKSDVLSISVYGEEDLQIPSIPIRPDGQISFPLIGDLQAEGKTVKELSDDLTAKLTRYLTKPRVSVIAQQLNSQQYTVSGEVGTPNIYPLLTDITITQAIAKAGGLAKGQFHATLVEIADLSHAFLSRHSEMLPIDFVALLRHGDMRFDVKLMPGDYLYIPSGLANQIYVLGEVTKPDLMAFNEGMSLSRALAQVTGFTPEADISRIHVVRGSLSNPVLTVIDMNKVLNGQTRDIELKQGDIVYVPPRGITSWSRMVNQIFPSFQAIQSFAIVQKTMGF